MIRSMMGKKKNKYTVSVDREHYKGNTEVWFDGKHVGDIPEGSSEAVIGYAPSGESIEVELKGCTTVVSDAIVYGGIIFTNMNIKTVMVVGEIQYFSGYAQNDGGRCTFFYARTKQSAPSEPGRIAFQETSELVDHGYVRYDGFIRSKYTMVLSCDYKTIRAKAPGEEIIQIDFKKASGAIYATREYTITVT